MSLKRLCAAGALAGLLATTWSGVNAAADPSPPAPAATDQASAAQDAGADRFAPSAIDWGTCASRTLQEAGAQCGLLTLPLDYANPDGRKIKIGVSRVKHTVPDEDYQGVMLVNPGGPGGSGLAFAILGKYVPKDAGAAYDWIGFDPRGVGTSVPSLECNGSYFHYNRPDYVPFTDGLERRWLDRTAAYSAACDQDGGALLSHMRTVDSVRDMNTIRKSLGADQINFYGFSYGTYLGQVFATRYPERVRRMVWDGVVDERDVWYQANLNQDVAFDRNIGIYFAWIASHDATYHLGTTQAAVQAKWDSLLAKTRQAPLDGKIGPSELTDAFTTAPYYVYGWEDVASAFVAALAGDNGPVTQLYDEANGFGPGSDNGYAVYLAVQCTDVQWPQSWDRWKRDNWAIYQRAPFLTWSNAWYNAPCLTWGASAPRQAPAVDGSAAPPILLISETYDAATPFPGALQARRLFPNSVLIEGVGGTTHAGSLSGVACTDDRIADYLLTGELDPRQPGNGSDVKCPPVPPPNPSASARSAASGAAQELRDLRTHAR